MLRRSRHNHEWTDEELDALVAETSGYEYEDDFEDKLEKRSSRRRIEELRELRKLRVTLDDFDDAWEEDDFDDSGLDDDDEYSENWH